MAGRPHCAIVARHGRVAIRFASALATKLLLCVQPAPAAVPDREIDARVERLLARMTVAETIGQLSQVNGVAGRIPDDLRASIQAGRIGSVLNEVDLATVNELQRIAVNESRLGIPLLIGRDVIHGFKTVLPIPLGQAATWNPDLVERGARVAALEDAASGVNWTFAPMVDVSRDPRWGRIAESFGEDPYVSFAASFAMSLGPVMWVLFSELFSNRLRGIAISFVGLINSAVSFAVQLVFPWQLQNLGNATTFLIYAAFALVGLPLIVKLLPETKGKTLEALEAELRPR